MKRQAMLVSLNDLARQKQQIMEEWYKLPGNIPLDRDKKFQVNIVNETGLSDDWKLEDSTVELEKMITIKNS